MKELQDKIDSTINWLTDSNRGNAVDESDIRDAKIELKELKEQLRLYSVSHQRELLKAFQEFYQTGDFNDEYSFDANVDKFLKAFNCG